MKMLSTHKHRIRDVYRKNRGMFGILIIAFGVSLFSIEYAMSNYEKLIIYEAQDKAKDASIIVASLIEEDFESYEKLSLVTNFQTQKYDKLYLTRLQNLFQKLKIDLDVTYIYTFKQVDDQYMMYIVDGDDPNSKTYMAPGSLEVIPGNAAWEKVFRSQSAGTIDIADYGELFGELFSGYAPIRNPETQAIIGYVEIDYTVDQAMSSFSDTIYLSTLTASLLFTISVLVLFYILYRLRNKDELTGLQNREAAQIKISKLILRDQIEAMVMISLDDFKFVNNTFGQDAGDRILKLVASTLKTSFPKHSVYRYEGDIFLLICTHDDMGHSTQIAKLEELFSQAWIYNDIKVNLRASIGFISKDFIKSSKEALYYAEHCVSESRRTSHTKVTEMTQNIVTSIKRQSHILESLRREIAIQGFELHYQPIYDVKRQSFRSAEALLRMSDPVLGKVSPAEFIPIAEKAGLIIDMGYIALEKLCQMMERMNEAKLDYDAISLNLSALQLSDANLLDKITRILNKYPIDISKLRFEITESSFIGNYGPVKKLMNDLGRKGIKFYLDDFGTGYSNFAVINRLNFEAIKIDKSLLNSSSQYRDHELLGGFIKIFTEFGKQVIIEGVETPHQQSLVEGFGVQYIQGYLFAKPMPEDEIKDYFACIT